MRVQKDVYRVFKISEIINSAPTEILLEILHTFSRMLCSKVTGIYLDPQTTNIGKKMP